MAWETPWVIGGASHSGEVLRLLSHAAFRGQHGVLGALDCRVVETAVPGPNIQVMPGAANVEAKGVGNDYQSYTSALLAAETVGISPTDASGPRSDLIIARVEDPNVTGGGWTAPDPVTGPFMFVRVIPGVPNTTSHVSQVRPDDSAITLARIDIPGGTGNETGTITNSMIKDLRSIADLGGQRVDPDTPTTTPPPIAQEWWTDVKHASSGSQLLRTDTTFKQFPSEGVWDVPIPSWAAGVDVIIDYNPSCNAHIWGEARLMMGGTATGIPSPFDDNASPSGAGYRPNIKIGGTYTIPTTLRGRIIQFRLEAKQFGDDPTYGATLGTLTANTGTFMTLLLHFKRYPIYN